MLFENENPIDIVLVLLHQYPQIETWLQSMEYHGTVTTSRTHAVQFLTSLMDSQPQFTQLIKLIQQQLKQRRAGGGDPRSAAQNIISGAGGSGSTSQMQHPSGSGTSGGAGTGGGGAGGGGPHGVNMGHHNVQSAGSGNTDNPDGSGSDGDKKKRKKSGRDKKSKSGRKDRKKKSKRSSKGKGSKKSSKRKRRKNKHDDDDDNHHHGHHHNGHHAEEDPESDYAPTASSLRKTSSSSRKSGSKRKRKSTSRRSRKMSSDEEPEYSGMETEEDDHSAMDSGESDDYNPGVNIVNIGSRKSDRKRRPKKRSLNEMSNGSYAVSKKKRQKTGHSTSNNGGGAVRRRGSNLAQYISPAPIHWKIQSVEDLADDSQRGRFRIKMSVQKHPIKEALIKIGAKTFSMDEMLDTLTAVEAADSEYEVEVKRTKPARKRLQEELMVIRGCYRVIDDEEHGGGRSKNKRYNGDGSGSDYEDPVMGGKRKRGEEEFSALEFLKFNAKQTTAQDSSDDTCYTCGKCGELVLCDGCPHAFHILCVGLTAVPEDDWFCNECQRKKQNEHSHRLIVNSSSAAAPSSHSLPHSHSQSRDGGVDPNADVEMGEATDNGNDRKVEDNRRVLSAIFMANKGDGRISDMTEINNAVHAATATDANQADDGITQTESNPVDDGFPEPDIDVVVDTEADLQVQAEAHQELPSPDAPDSGLDHDAEFEPQSEPQMEIQPDTNLESQSQSQSQPQPQHQPQPQPERESQDPAPVDPPPEQLENGDAVRPQIEHSHPEEASQLEAEPTVPSVPDPKPTEPQNESKEEDAVQCSDGVMSSVHDEMTHHPPDPTETLNHSEEHKEESLQQNEEQCGEVGDVTLEPTESAMVDVVSKEDERPPVDTEMVQETVAAEDLSVSNGTDYENKEDGRNMPSDAKLSSGPSDTGDDLSMNNEEENNTDTDNTENIPVEANKHLETERQGLEQLNMMEHDQHQHQHQHQGEGIPPPRDHLENLQLSSKMQTLTKLNSMDVEEKETEQDDGRELTVPDPTDNLLLTGSQEY